MRPHSRFALLSCLLLAAQSSPAEPAATKPAAFSKEMAAFEKQDTQKPFAAGGIVFAGSSSFRMWNVNAAFPDRPVLNRGFGGSNFPQLLENFATLISKHQPAIVLIYEGDNDLKQGRTAEQILADFQTLRSLMEAQLPKTKVIFAGIKPSPSRKNLWSEAVKANSMVQSEIAKWPNASYVDTAAPLMNADGEPDPALFKEDMLHLNPAGYEKWNPVFEAAFERLQAPKK